MSLLLFKITEVGINNKLVLESNKASNDEIGESYEYLCCT